MNIFLTIVLFGILFYLLGKSADLVVLHVRSIGKQLNIPVFFLGLILGLFTSLPETAIGIYALTQGVSNLSFGNLIGGFIVLFTLILGFSIVLNRKIKTDGRATSILPMLVYLFLPCLFALDGTIGLIEGSLCILWYFALIYFLYREQPPQKPLKAPTRTGEHGLKTFFMIGMGLTGLGLFSNLIMKLSLDLLSAYGLSPFVMGLLVFSVGTNLPEIIVAISSHRRHMAELTVSHLFGSAIANILLIGIFASIKPFQIIADLSFAFLCVFIIVLFLLLISFYRSGKKFARGEGLALLALYVIFVLGQIFLFGV